MAFGPILGGGSGGGGGGSTAYDPVYLTGTTGSIDETDENDLDIALPAGITRCEVVWVFITVTAGLAASVKLTLHLDDGRSGDPTPCYLYGNAFGGADVGKPGPLDTTGGNATYNPSTYTNVDGAEFLRLSVGNVDFAEPGTFKVDLIIRPLPTLTGES